MPCVVCRVPWVVSVFDYFGNVRDESTDFDTSAVHEGLSIGPPTSVTRVASRSEFAELGRGMCLIASGSQWHSHVANGISCSLAS